MAGLLTEEHEDVEELAKEVCRLINRMRATEPYWVRVVRHGTGYLMYGPYQTAEAARADDVSRGPGKDEDVEVRLWSLIPPFGQTDDAP